MNRACWFPAALIAMALAGCAPSTEAAKAQPRAAEKRVAPLPCVPTGMTLDEANRSLDTLTLQPWSGVDPEKQMAMLWHLAKQMHGRDGEAFWQYRARLYFVLLNDEENWKALPKDLPVRPLLKAAAELDRKIKVWRQPEDFHTK